MQEELEDTKGVIKIRILKKNRQHIGQKKEYKRTNNDLQKHTHKTRDRVTRTTIKTGGEIIILIFSCPPFQSQKSNNVIILNKKVDMKIKCA